MEGGGETHDEHEQRALRERNVLCIQADKLLKKASLESNGEGNSKNMECNVDFEGTLKTF